MPISSQQKKAATRKLVVTPQPIRGKAPVGGDNVSKAVVLTRMLENDAIRAIRAPSGDVEGFIDKNGGVIKQASILWSEFLALTPAMVADEAVVYVRDKQCMFIWNALASRWFHTGGRLMFDDFTQPPAPSAKWQGLKCWVKSGIGIGGAEIEVRLVGSDYFWRYTAGRALLDSINTDILFTPSDGHYTTESLVRSVAIPINNLKSLMQIGDFAEIVSVVGRTSTATTFTRAFRLGAANTVGDTYVESVTIATGQPTSGERNILRRKASNKVIVAGAQSSNKWAGTSGSARNVEATVTGMDSAVSYLSLTLDQSADTNENLALADFYVHLFHAGG